jgi:cephalosporin hydroxylase
MDIVNSDLGSNADILLQRIENIQNGTLVDLGVRYGVSSYIMLTDSKKNKNRVYGVDLHNLVSSEVINHPNYTFIQSDSIECGKNWTCGEVDVLFVDTLHIKEQVLCELYYWYPHLKNGSLIIFHDTNWPIDKKDFYNGQYWDRPEEAIKLFFNLDTLQVKDEKIIVDHFEDSWGMTFVHIIKKDDSFGQNIDWDIILKFHES